MDENELLAAYCTYDQISFFCTMADVFLFYFLVFIEPL